MKQATFGILAAAICAMANASPGGAANGASKFVTPIRCKTFSGRLVSICQPTREKFGPPVCRTQTLQIDEPSRSPSFTLFKASSKRASIGQHAFHWQCFATESHTEVVAVSIVNIEHGDDEDVWLFDRYGKRLSRRAESQVFGTPAWSQARSGEQLNSQGLVSLPAINE